MHMKKLLLLFLCISALVSCGGDEGVLGPDSGNPLSECAVPDTVQAGGELVLQWNGFEDAAAIALKSSAVEYDLEVEVVTSSGLIALVPREVTPGVYDVMLTQSVSMKLGAVEVTAADQESGSEENPDTGDEPGTDPEPDPEPGTDPEPEPGTDPDPGVDPEPGPEPPVDVPSTGKRLIRLEYIEPYLGSASLMKSWEISAEEPITLTASESVIEGSDITEQNYDTYVCDASGIFRLDYEGMPYTDNRSMEYMRNADGRISSTQVVRYNKKSAEFSWEYNADGCLTQILATNGVKCSLGYTNGNLTSFRTMTFEYDDPSLVNSQYAANVVWGYMATDLFAFGDPFIFFPYLLGWYRMDSVVLPTAILLPDPDPAVTTPKTCPLTYIFDEDGYVVEMNWKNGGTPCKVKYIYE